MICSHQSILIKSHILKKYPFDLKYRIASDYNTIYTAYKLGYKFKKVNEVIAEITANGLSDRKRILSLKERLDICHKYSRSIKISAFYAAKMLEAIVKLALSKAVPNRIG